MHRGRPQPVEEVPRRLHRVQPKPHPIPLKEQVIESLGIAFFVIPLVLLGALWPGFMARAPGDAKKERLLFRTAGAVHVLGLLLIAAGLLSGQGILAIGGCVLTLVSWGGVVAFAFADSYREARERAKWLERANAMMEDRLRQDGWDKDRLIRDVGEWLGERET